MGTSVCRGHQVFSTAALLPVRDLTASGVRCRMPGRICGVVDALSSEVCGLVPAPRGAVIACSLLGATVLDPSALRPVPGRGSLHKPVLVDDTGAFFPLGYKCSGINAAGASWLHEAGVIALAGARGVQLCADHTGHGGVPHAPLVTLDAFDVFGEALLQRPSVHLAAGHGDAPLLVHVGGDEQESRIFVFVEPCAPAAALAGVIFLCASCGFLFCAWGSVGVVICA
jgi:hypothetical protein